MGLLGENEADEGRIEDLKFMIGNVIRKKFLHASREKTEDWDELPQAHKQLLIGRWYVNQNRMGQAVATGMEALRSFLVMLYKDKNGNPIPEMSYDENIRKAAYDRLKRVVAKINESEETKTEKERFLIRLSICAEKCRKIRNVFAHNCISGEQDVISAGGEKSESRILANAKQDIRELFSLLEELRDYVDSDGCSIGRFFDRGNEKNKQYTHINKGSMVIVSNEKNMDKIWAVIGKNQSDRDIYHIHSKIMKIIKKDRDSSKADELTHVWMLFEYLERNGVFDDSTAEIIFIDVKLRQKLSYYPFLQYKTNNQIMDYVCHLNNKGFWECEKTEIPNIKYMNEITDLKVFEENRTLENVPEVDLEKLDFNQYGWIKVEKASKKNIWGTLKGGGKGFLPKKDVKDICAPRLGYKDLEFPVKVKETMSNGDFRFELVRESEC